MQNTILFFDQLKLWISRSVSLKLFMITFLALILLIPSNMLKTLIHERSYNNSDAVFDIRSKWAMDQTITPPIISVPIEKINEIDGKTIKISTFYHFLPENLNINGDITPEQLHRGIYEVTVYSGRIDIHGNFPKIEQSVLSNFETVYWDKAIISLGISDLRGIQQQILLKLNNVSIQGEPGIQNGGLVNTGLSFPLNHIPHWHDGSNFSLKMELQGSESIGIIPVGATSEVKMKSNWTSPSFDGHFLPDTRDINNQGFDASWKILNINRDYPQSFEGNGFHTNLNQSAFNVQFLNPIDTYMMNLRAIKYALLNIALTFLVFFIVEIMLKRKIHPIQYVLVGLSIVMFYALLLSLSEHFPFNKAFLLASGTTSLMIYLYSMSVFKQLKASIVLLLLSTVNYTFIYITLQMNDYALLLGSIGLTFILGVTMYSTRKINWFELSKAE